MAKSKLLQENLGYEAKSIARQAAPAGSWVRIQNFSPSTYYLLIDSHGGHGVAGVGIIRQHVEDAAAVDKQPGLAHNQDLGGVQGSTRQPCTHTH